MSTDPTPTAHRHVDHRDMGPGFTHFDSLDCGCRPVVRAGVSQPANQSETDHVIARLKALSVANLGRTASDDEVIDGVCESAVEELERLRALLPSKAL